MIIVVENEKIERIKSELSARYERISLALRTRHLERPPEGAKRGHWVYPERLRAISADDVELRMARR